MIYKKCLMRQQRYDGQSYTNVGPVVDTQEAFNVVCQEFPFKVLPEIKEPAKRDWHDEHGEDVFIPADGFRFQAYDLEVKFLYAKEDLAGYQTYKSGGGTLTYDEWISDQMKTDISNFIKYLYGRNTGGSPMLAVYDEYTKIGRRGIYVMSVDNDLFFYNDANIDAIAEFKVKFRVTDPVTELNHNLQPISDSSSSE